MLKKVSFEVEIGKVVCVMGCNGVGKMLLMWVVVG